MAEDSNADSTLERLTPHNRVWTFSISSGQPFRLGLPNNPPLNYRGGREIWKISAPKSTADAVLRMMQTLDVSVVRYCEEETPEQTQERRRRLGLSSSR